MALKRIIPFCDCSLVIGGVIGECIDIEKRLKNLGIWMKISSQGVKMAVLPELLSVRA